MLRTVMMFFLVLPVMLFAQIAVTGELVYSSAGDPIQNGVVLLKDGKIEKVGAAADVAIPDGYRVMSGKVISPGLIDAHSVVGIAGMYNTRFDQDQLDKSSPIQPELRAMDAYNGREGLVEWVRRFGVTTLHTGHAPGALISGQTVIVKTDGETLETAVVKPTAMMTMTLGSNVRSNFKSPGTRAKGMAMIRSQLFKSQGYAKKVANAKKDKMPERDLAHEAIGKTLSGEMPVLLTAQRSTEIMSALRLAKEFDLNLVLDGAAEAYMLLDKIKAADVPVIIHPTMARNRGDTRNATYETAAKLHKAGILFAFQSGYEGYVPKTRVLVYEAAIAVANGLPADAAIKAMTIDAAKILGIDARVGSLEAGKDADVVIYDGDPFEYTSHVCGVIINGKVVSEECE